MKQRLEFRIGVGASSILMILVVLALAALSLLSLSSARNNQALSQRNLSMALRYYQAAAEAQQKLAAIDAVLAEHAGNTAAEDWQARFDAQGLSDVAVSDDMTFRFSLDAGAQRELAVAGTLSPDQSPRYTLTVHELRNVAIPGDETMQLLIP